MSRPIQCINHAYRSEWLCSAEAAQKGINQVCKASRSCMSGWTASSSHCRPPCGSQKPITHSMRNAMHQQKQHIREAPIPCDTTTDTNPASYVPCLCAQVLCCRGRVAAKRARAPCLSGHKARPSTLDFPRCPTYLPLALCHCTATNFRTQSTGDGTTRATRLASLSNHREGRRWKTVVPAARNSTPLPTHTQQNGGGPQLPRLAGLAWETGTVHTRVALLWQCKRG